jgi:GNAT superfamily N-acetyltransferase
MPEDFLDGLRPEDWASRYTFGDLRSHRPATTVAVDDGVICGFSTTAPSSDVPECAELQALYVDPEHWNRGVGRELIGEACSRMAALGFTEAFLWVLSGNARAERFYRISGWEPDGSSRLDEVRGITVVELRYCRRLQPDS